MAGALLWGYDATNKKWIPLAVDENGYVKVDLSNINLDDLANVSVASPTNGHIFYYDGATGLWKAKAHTDLTTGVHGVGASTIESVAGSQAKVNAHNALVLSHLVHNNDNWFSGYGAETIAGLPSHAKVPALTAISDPSSILNVADWYGASGAYRQSDADSDATHIQDDDASFPASIKYTIVKWASNAAGTLNTGIGVIYTVAPTLVGIQKCSGVNFAASYYYWIKHSEIVIPVTGLYLVTSGVLFLPAEIDKNFQLRVYTFTGTGAITQVASGEQSSPLAAWSKPMGAWIIPLTAGDSLFFLANHNGTKGTPTLYYGHVSHNPLGIFLLKQTA